MKDFNSFLLTEINQSKFFKLTQKALPSIFSKMLLLMLFTIATTQGSIAAGCSINPAATYSFPVCTSSNGSISMAPTGGTQPYKYRWSTGDSTATISRLGAGTYVVTVTDASQCTATRSFVLTAYMRAMNLSTTSIGDTCNGARGKATVTVVSNGVAPYQYGWSNGATAATASGLVANTYTATVTDVNGCSASASTVVSNIGTAIVQNGVVTQPICPATGGTIALNPTGGTSSVYRMQWSTGAVNPTVSGLGTGNYSVTVFGQNGCSTVSSYVVNAAPSAIVMNATVNHPKCRGDYGSININPSGGTGPNYTALWSNSANGLVSGSLSTGSYSLTVTDQNNCTAIQTFKVDSGLLINTVSTISAPVCLNPNGIIQMGTTNGKAPFSYRWADGDTSSRRTSLAVGSYSLTVSDANQCTVAQIVSLTAYWRPITLLATTVADTCSSAQGKASISVTSSSSVAPFLYKWADGRTSSSINGLTPGNYVVSVTDAYGCTASSTAVVSNYYTPITIASSISSPICTNPNGVIQVNASGGKFPYIYRWNSGDTSTTRTNLAAGNYIVTVTDKNSCTAVKTIGLTIYSTPTRSITTVVGDTCSANIGSANVTVLGGTAPFRYSWSNGGSTPIIRGLGARYYSVVVTDTNGCTTSSGASVTNFGKAINVNGTVTQPMCYNNKGRIAIRISGGTTDFYSLVWSNNAKGNNISDLSSGTYSITVNGTNGCSASRSFTIIQPDSIRLDYSTSPVRCDSAKGGVITQRLMTGAFYPWSFTWIGPNGYMANTPSLNQLEIGNYNLQVVDAHECKATANFNITATGNIALSTTSTNASCVGVDNGKVSLLSTTPYSTPISYVWSGPNGFTSTNTSCSHLAPGNYTITVSEKFGCSATKTENVGVAPPITIDYTASHVKCDSSIGGTIQLLKLTGATYPWQVKWTGPDSFTSSSISVNHLNEGSYSFEFVDANGCRAHGDYVIEKTGRIQSSYVTTNTTCPGVNDGSIQRQQLLPYSTPTFHWVGPNGFVSDSTSITHLSPGIYSLTINEPYGCTTTRTDTVLDGPSVSLVYASTPVNCDSAQGGTLHKTGEVNTYYPWNMQWNGPNGFVSAATNLDHLFAGSYSLQYTDSRGCGGTQYFNVDSLGSLSISYLPHIVTCRGASNGAIQFKSLRPYSALANYAWNGGANFSANTQSIYGLSPGEYTVTVSENYGCKTSKTFTIAESFDVGVAAIKNINCPAPGMQIIVHPLAGDLAQLQGNHCATAISGQVKMIVNGAAHYSGTVQGALIPTVNGDTLVWDVSDYGTLRIDSSFFVKLDVDTTAALGSQICITMEVTPEQGDYNPSNNKASYCMTVIRAYDPNEKQVFPEGDILATQESFVYTVHFQNVGTGAAHTVYVLDTLDQQFDPKSFSVLASSFPAQTTLKGDAIRFQFNNIDLTPASQNWQASEGWIQYAVKPKHALVLGTAIQNTAHIYFDYNTPITTNTTVNRVVEHQGESTGIMNNEQELLFYPNPVKNYLYLHLNSNIAVNTAQVLDVEGRLITSKLLVGQHHSIPMDNLAEGVYWLRLTLKTGGSIVKKFIKE